MHYCCSLIAQVEYQGQTRYAWILDSKPFINKCYGIGHRLELKYHHFAVFAHFLLNNHLAAQQLQSEDLKFRTDIQDWVLGNWFVNLVSLQRQIAKKSSNRKFKLVLSLLVFISWLSNIALFHMLQIWLQTLVAIDSDSCQTKFPGQSVQLDLLLCTGFESKHADLFLCHIHPETNKQLNNWGKWWVLICSATTSRQFH